MKTPGYIVIFIGNRCFVGACAQGGKVPCYVAQLHLGEFDTYEDANQRIGMCRLRSRFDLDDEDALVKDGTQ